MFKRVALLSLPAAGLALLGASIVFAQQGQPGSESIRVVVPQATPQGPQDGGPRSGNQPNNPAPTDNPNLPTNPGPTAPQPAPPSNIPLPPGPAPTGLSYMMANAPADLQAIRELPPVASAPVSMTAASPELQQIRELPPVSGLAAVPMNIDSANSAIREAPPVPSAPVSMTAAPLELQQVRELPPVPQR